MKSIAVLMLVYKNDRLDNVKASLNSLYEQTYDWIDIYIQEDGVIDNCVHDFLLRELSENRISYLGFRNEHKGIAYSRNELLKVSFPKGYQYIATMDSDDISLANRIEKQFSFMEKNKYIDVCGTYIEEFGDGIDYNKVVTYPTTHSEMFAFFKKRVPLANVTSLFRVSFFHKAGLYEIEGHINNEDTLMWMKGFMNDCKFANIDYIGVKVRVSRDFLLLILTQGSIWRLILSIRMIFTF